ncbi:hypothetical protein QJS04_geneDACA005363 [Acorus gramineus]|uniref:PB1 domain-containing protein n=1 Tax=Acorus gramineus TaxID=55184 RepID=A0AAV9AZU9_ACOGR|nr:hypothetical protein QJS04_geneDACA005363 [Acorus gramineus]
MGKHAAKKNKPSSGRSGDEGSKHSKPRSPMSTAFDDDTNIFIDMAKGLREEGNKAFQKRDHEGALLKYEKALKLLPKSHVDAPYLRSNIAACYMQMNPPKYHRAIDECNLALEASPKYTKALLKRARCYDALSRLDLAIKDVEAVLVLEPNNLTALDIGDRIKKDIEKKGINLDVESVGSNNEAHPPVVVKERSSKKRNSHRVKAEDKVVVVEDEKLSNGDVGGGDVVKEEVVKERSRKKKNSHRVKAEDKVVVVEKEKLSNGDVGGGCVVKEEVMKGVKLVFGEDIRWAQFPADCSVLCLREVVGNKFPGFNAVLVKYKDREGDLVTITTTEELRWAEDSVEPQGSLRLYITEVDPERDPLLFEESRNGTDERRVKVSSVSNGSENGSAREGEQKGVSSTFIEDWIVQFARLFKNHLGIDSDECLDLHELGMKLYSEAIEETVTCEDAQELFDLAEEKFQEMAAMALFNWGNIHMSRARKRLHLSEDPPSELVVEQVRTAYEWAQKEYVNAGKRYDEALKIKPDFCEGLLAMGQQQFEQAKLSWYYAIGSKVDLELEPSISTKIMDLFNSSEESMERGTQMWEEMEEKRLNELAKPNQEKVILEKMGLEGLFKEITTDEAAEQAANMRSQVNLLWGTMLYERSVVEFKLGLPIWEECLMDAVEKFKLAGASPSDIAVMRKNHCSNETATEGLGFKIDEIVQAWNEMYDANRWLSGVPSFRLEPLFLRRVPKLHQQLEHV